MFMNAVTDEDFIKVLSAVKEEFKDGIPEGISSYLSIFCKAENDIVKNIILNFSIEIYSDPRNTIIKALKKQEEEKNVDHIFDMITGWLKNKIESLIVNGEPPFVGGKEFRAQLFASRRELSQSQFLHDYAQSPNLEENRVHLNRVYVKQLELVSCDIEEKIDAISSYIRSRTNKLRWAEDGLVHGNSFDEFYLSIQNKWRYEQRKAAVLYKQNNPEERGRMILYECSIFREKLSGLHVPSHFTKGCFNDCSDKLEIGWHEDYLNLLSG
jgi:hypothetical protein